MSRVCIASVTEDTWLVALPASSAHPVTLECVRRVFLAEAIAANARPAQVASCLSVVALPCNNTSGLEYSLSGASCLEQMNGHRRCNWPRPQRKSTARVYIHTYAHICIYTYMGDPGPRSPGRDLPCGARCGPGGGHSGPKARRSAPGSWSKC